MAAGVILAALFLTRGGIASLLPLLRLALPAVVVVLVYRSVKSKIRGAVDDALRHQGGDLRGGPGRPGGAGPAAGPVIDLCPQCGAYKQPGHRCTR